MENKFYVILGGAGCIGSNIIELLEQKNIRYISIDKKNPINKQIFSLKRDLSLHYTLGNLSNIVNIIKHTNIENKKYILINCASDKIPFFDERFTSCINNIGILFNSIEIAKELNADIIYLSTSDCYGFTEIKSEDKDSIIGSSSDKRWSYSASKIIGEHLYFGYHEKYGNNIYNIRLFNCMGKYCNLEEPWKSGLPTALIYNAITKESIDINCGLGLARSYIDIDDFISALFFILDNDKCKNSIINVGNDKNFITVGQLLDILKNKLQEYKLQHDIAINFTTKRASDIFHKKANIDLLRYLGWKPTISFEESFDKLFRYIYNYIKKI